VTSDVLDRGRGAHETHSLVGSVIAKQVSVKDTVFITAKATDHFD